MVSSTRDEGPQTPDGPDSADRAEDGGRAPRSPRLVVRYGALNWVGEFAHKSNATIASGTTVVLQTDRGIELGQHVGPSYTGCAPAARAEQMRAYVDQSGPEFCRFQAGRVLRMATAQDIDEQKHLNAHTREDIECCAQLATELGLDMKVVTAEHLLGGERIVFYFASTTRVDFRQLVKELAHRYRTRIEMRQVGARDEARLVADYEVCGRECCCKNFLKKLRPVNMKMAKLQKSTLDPSKVSGRCGRLRCCLRYEHVGYEELAAKLPRPGSRVDTEFGPATVVEQQILTQLVMVRTDENRLVSIPREEIKAFNLPPAPPKPAPEAPPTERRSEPSDRARERQKSRRQGRERRGASPGSAARGPAGGRPSARKDRAEDVKPPRGRPPAPAADSVETGTTPAQAQDPARELPEQSTGGAKGPPGDDGVSQRSEPRRRRRRRRRRPKKDGPASPSGAGSSA